MELSRRFDDATLFAVAHEYAHRVLQHYARRNAGERQYDLELEADRFATITAALARNMEVVPAFPDPTDPPTARVINLGHPVVLTSRRGCYFGGHFPTGDEDYFSFGYAFAGFPETGPDYPSRAERAAALEGVSYSVVRAIRTAQAQRGLCNSPGVPTDPPAYAARKEQELKNELAQKRQLVAEAPARLNNLVAKANEAINRGSIAEWSLARSERTQIEEKQASAQRSVKDLEASLRGFPVWTTVYLEFLRILAPSGR